jgi:NhaA family Na+:H+ antiporter
MKTEHIDHLLRPVQSFIKHESTAGFLLIACAAGAMILANSPLAAAYHSWWDYEFSILLAGHGISKSLHHWINDGLMAMFFFVIGLELKREVVGGELASPRNAMLPLAAAAGGMVVPALIFVFLNPASPAQDGWGIPMATDIAFALGILSILGKRVPLSIKIFLTALAIVDDLGAVLVIALFYTSDISLLNLATGAAFLGLLVAGNYAGIRSVWFYALVGIGGLWFAFLMSGVHATVAGVLAALAIPARNKIDEAAFISRLRKYVDEFERIPPSDSTLLEAEQRHVVEKIEMLTRAADTPLQRLEHALHPVVLFIVMPVFAFSNAGISLDGLSFQEIVNPVTLGVFFGLVIGKFTGVVGFSWLCVKMKWAEWPADMTFRHVIGVGFLAGIGFTMSLFITNLAFSAELAIHAKFGILAASLLAGATGFLILHKVLPKNG